jgi:hypothetical protein
MWSVIKGNRRERPRVSVEFEKNNVGKEVRAQNNKNN